MLLFRFKFKILQIKSSKNRKEMSSTDKKFILVTGGTGLVGSAIRRAVEMEGEKANETFMFLSSKDLDLT